MSEEEIYEEEELVEEELIEEDSGNKEASGFTKYLPTFMISTAIHALILFIISLLPGQAIEETKKVIIVQDMQEVKEEPPPPEMEEPEIEEVTEVTLEETTEDTVEEEVEEVVMEEAMENEEIEEVFEEVTNSANPDNMPVAAIGLSGGGPAGGGGLPPGYSGRSKRGKKRGVGRYGGKGTTNAVDAALAWLHHHQEPDGSWDAVKYDGTYKHNEPITAAALLAFLGAGHSEQVGKYRKTVRKGLNYLNEHYDKMMKRNGHDAYTKGMVLMALSEACIFGTSARTKENANNLAKWHIDGYYAAGAKAKPSKVAWRYNGGTEHPDQSVSGWVALGLKSAKAAELPIMKTKDAIDLFYLYEKYVKQATNEDKGRGCYGNNNLGSLNMDLVGMFQRQFIGFPKDDPYITKVGRKLEGGISQRCFGDPTTPKSAYAIYYGTLAAFQQQGTVWKKWNQMMKTCLLKSQRKGDPRKLGGSWDKCGSWISRGGRPLTTALFALCLEVYYRYDLM